MCTGSTVVASRLVWAAGWRTPPSSAMHARLEDFAQGEDGAPDAGAVLSAGPAPVDGYYRVSAVRWPPGIIIGESPEEGTPPDDPNDVVPHQDRRTLRGVQVLSAWLKLHDLGPRKTLDVYEGAPGQGHLVHYLVGLDDSLGAGDVARASDPPPGEGGGGPWTRLFTLGLAPNPRRTPTQTEVPGIGEINGDVDIGYWSGLPYAPVERMQASDGYWAAKRIASISSAAIAMAIDAARFTDERAQRRLHLALEERKQRLARYWYGRTTPLEFVSATREAIVLRDEAISRALVGVAESSYEVNFLDVTGHRAAPATTMAAHTDRFMLVLPESARIAARTYLVVRVQGRRAKGWLPRVFEIHVKLAVSGIEVLGIRH